MEPALKQRVVGAVVLVALAVIFLPMLIKGPAPESGVSDVPLKLPDAPQADGSMQTRELPLVAPAAAPASGVVGMDASQPEDAAPAAAGAQAGMMPASTAGGDYAVSFGRYATAADADKVVAALRDSQLPGYQEAVTDKGRSLYSVRIGPFATQADAESARLRAAHVRDDVGAKVIVLNADAAPPVTTATAPSTEPALSVSQPVAAASTAPAKPEPLAQTKPAPAKPAEPTLKPAPPKEAVAKPAAPAPKPAAPIGQPTKPAPAPAAAETGFAVQLGAFSSAAEATKLRDRARAAGLHAFVESVRTDKGVLSRVRVGPVLTRAEADQLRAQVAAKLGIGDAIVKPHP
jgi:cell division septation protein DedD